MSNSVKKLAKRLIGQPTAYDYTERIVRSREVQWALDIGCRETSILSEFRPRIKCAGIDAFKEAVETSKSKGLHDKYLSGWFGHDFLGLGYQVFGTTGVKYLLGYAGMFKINIPGVALLDGMLAWLLRAHKRYWHALNLVAVKDMGGVPARLASPQQPEPS